MKGYIGLLLGWFFMLIIFVLVNWYLSTRLYFETGVSDVAGQTYKMINAIEFAKINSQQNLKFAVQKTEKELLLNPGFQNNDQLKTIFLDRLKKNYYPSHDYSDVDVSISVISLSIEDNFVIAKNSFSSISESRLAGLTTSISVPLS